MLIWCQVYDCVMDLGHSNENVANTVANEEALFITWVSGPGFGIMVPRMDGRKSTSHSENDTWPSRSYAHSAQTQRSRLLYVKDAPRSDELVRP